MQSRCHSFRQNRPSQGTLSSARSYCRNRADGVDIELELRTCGGCRCRDTDTYRCVFDTAVYGFLEPRCIGHSRIIPTLILGDLVLRDTWSHSKFWEYIRYTAVSGTHGVIRTFGNLVYRRRQLSLEFSCMNVVV